MTVLFVFLFLPGAFRLAFCLLLSAYCIPPTFILSCLIGILRLLLSVCCFSLSPHPPISPLLLCSHLEIAIKLNFWYK